MQSMEIKEVCFHDLLWGLGILCSYSHMFTCTKLNNPLFRHNFIGYIILPIGTLCGSMRCMFCIHEFPLDEPIESSKMQLGKDD